MKSTLHVVLQTGATALQGVNIATLSGYLHILPPKYAAIAMFLIAAGQSVLGIYNHYFNPDGTAAAFPYYGK